MAQRLPLFPLGTVLVPGLVLPLHIFEPRYRQLVADLEDLPEDEREFGVVAIREGGEVGAGSLRALYDVGCAATAAAGHDCRRRPQPDPVDRGAAVPAARPGRRRGHAVPDRSWWSGWTSRTATSTRRVPLRSRALWARVHRAARAASGRRSSRTCRRTPGPLSYLLTTAVVMPLHQRQGLLSAASDAERLTAINRLLRSEVSIMSVGAVTAPAGCGRPAQLTEVARRPGAVGVHAGQRPSRAARSAPGPTANSKGANSSATGVCRTSGVIGALTPAASWSVSDVRPEPDPEAPGDQPGRHAAAHARPPARPSGGAAGDHRPDDAQQRAGDGAEDGEPAVLRGHQLVVALQVDPAVLDHRRRRRREPPPEQAPGQAGRDDDRHRATSVWVLSGRGPPRRTDGRPGTVGAR